MVEEDLHRRLSGEAALNVGSRVIEFLLVSGEPPRLLPPGLVRNEFDVAILGQDAQVIRAAGDALPEYLSAPRSGGRGLAADQVNQLPPQRMSQRPQRLRVSVFHDNQDT